MPPSLGGGRYKAVEVEERRASRRRGESGRGAVTEGRGVFLDAIRERAGSGGTSVTLEEEEPGWVVWDEDAGTE